MGCFSFICPECGKGIKSTSFSGEKCRLHLLKDGKVIQEMRGEYDSYGRTFIEDSRRGNIKDIPISESLKESNKWDMEWSDVCNLIFSDDHKEGIAGVHEKCFKEVPTVQSKDDPNQGCGDEDGFEEEHD